MKKTVLALLLGLFCMQIQTVVAAPKSELWPRWQAHQQESDKIIDHTPWDRFLSVYLVTSEDGINRLKYGAVTKEDQAALDRYLKSLEKVAISQYSRNEQFAYWVNLYNAKTVALVLEHYPVESIKDISFGWFSFGPWDEKLLRVEGQSLSLNDIEHRILRPIWQDNRIHYAVNCASLGCPNLAAVAYTGKNSEKLLQAGAVAYINHPRGVSVDGQQLLLSKIYQWYMDDFGGNEKGLIKHFLKYAKPALAEQLKALQEPEIDYHYDWRLNQ